MLVIKRRWSKIGIQQINLEMLLLFREISRLTIEFVGKGNFRLQIN